MYRKCLIRALICHLLQIYAEMSFSPRSHFNKNSFKSYQRSSKTQHNTNLQWSAMSSGTKKTKETPRNSIKKPPSVMEEHSLGRQRESRSPVPYTAQKPTKEEGSQQKINTNEMIMMVNVPSVSRRRWSRGSHATVSATSSRPVVTELCLTRTKDERIRQLQMMSHVHDTWHLAVPKEIAEEWRLSKSSARHQPLQRWSDPPHKDSGSGSSRG